MILDSRYRKALLSVPLGVVFFLLLWLVYIPGDFPEDSIVEISEGMSLSQLSGRLEEERIITSRILFRAASTLMGGERTMKAGAYYFERPQNTVFIAWRIARGDHRIETVKLTVPEGFTVRKISALFGERFPFFDNAMFERTAPQGYLFPDTYFVPVSATASSTIKLMKDNFIRKIFPIMPEIELSGRTLEDIIVMASLIEGEANNQVDREMVSDVLWKRLKIGMPLQVDVDMTTYEFPGLPETPINNPGLLAIEAALHPTTTPYLYYLTGKDGLMYYSRTHEEHVEKKQRYLR